MDLTLLRHFVAAANEPRLERAASRLGVPLVTLNASLTRLETELGTQLFMRTVGTPNAPLTEAGELYVPTATAELAAAKGVAAPPRAGGKAKASKGQGRAPRVKGEPLPYKKRQSR